MNFGSTWLKAHYNNIWKIPAAPTAKEKNVATFGNGQADRYGRLQSYTEWKSWNVRKLLKSYDDGRRKGFYCAAVNLLALQDVKIVMGQIEEEIALEMPLKMKAADVVRLFEVMAEKRGISLKLRKKGKPT